MSKKITITLILLLTVFMTGIPKTYASQWIEATEAVSLAEEDSLNSISFEVNVNEAGSYYAEFWIMPAKYSDGGYTRFSVFVNKWKME